ncbi:MAG TPA: glycosyltransferase family 4 protein [Solirubrobacterales bacterium]|nr:glycosyltransferase family 4 protein [Solirubrobacterales bacterium]
MTPPEGKLNGLLWRRRALRRLLRPGARPEESFLPPIPIPDPTSGKLDHPGPGFEYRDGIVNLKGWVAFDSGSPVSRVEAELDDVPIGRARIGLPRTDVDETKTLPMGLSSGFEHSVEIVAALPDGERVGAKELRVVATAIDGERFEFDPVPVFLRPVPTRPTELELDVPPPPRAPEPRGSALRVLVFTHQLTLGGAQLYLLDLIGELRRRDVEMTVVSLVDGPLHDELDSLGIPVHLTSIATMERLDAHVGRVAELTAWASGGDFDVVFVNTATSGASFGAEVAKALGLPAVWAIHESFSPLLLWADLRPAVRERTEVTLGQAAYAVFEADATRRIFEPLVESDRCLTIPYGVDLRPIERERAKLDISAARREAGFTDDEMIILCVGTVEPRKAQVQLAQAFGLVAGEHPGARLVFVGTRKGDPHTEELEDVVADSPVGSRIELIPVSPDVQTWYAIADVLACASDVESLPRTVLEAMLWETPVLATSVFGIPELIEDGVNGWLCEPRDLGALAEGLDRVMSTGESERRQLAVAARSLVEERHDLPRYADHVLDVLNRATGTTE